ncbi:MAG: glycosyltransferase, partial [Microcoleus sp. SIO2G3]|nr:glycosyltransferase [Microcoleus sp. SIO2G3]
MSIYQPSSLLPVPSGSLQIPLAVDSELADASPELFNDEIQPRLRKTEYPILFSLVIPTYNEGNNTPKIVALLSQILDEAIPDAYELIVVDDNSPDGTWKIAQELMPEYPQLRVMRRVEERGLSTAVIRGWQAARGEVLGVIDADLQHPPEVLLQLWNEIQRGADLAVASRHVDGGGVSD